MAECQAAVKALQPGKKIQYLAELTGAEFAQYQHFITDETVMRRARHAVLENERTSLAVKTLKEGDLATFGQLMNDSHDSLRYDYEVTGLELDTLVEETRKIPGVIGSRMTGAGFGGCTVSLVKDEAVENLIKTVGPAYHAITGLTADFYVAEIGDGAKQLEG